MAPLTARSSSGPPTSFAAILIIIPIVFVTLVAIFGVVTYTVQKRKQAERRERMKPYSGVAVPPTPYGGVPATGYDGAAPYSGVPVTTSDYEEGVQAPPPAVFKPEHHQYQDGIIR